MNIHVFIIYKYTYIYTKLFPSAGRRFAVQ